jgi:hypothetical protein
MNSNAPWIEAAVCFAEQPVCHDISNHTQGKHLHNHAPAEL